MKAYTTIQDFIDALSQLDTSQPLNSIGQGMKKGKAYHIVHYGRGYRDDTEAEIELYIPIMKGE